MRPGPLDELTRANPAYISSLWEDYRRDPRSVDERWALIFAGIEYGLASPRSDGAPDVADIVHTFRELGHLVADLDPLGHSSREHPLLSLRELGLSESDLDREVDWAPFKPGMRGPLRALLEVLRATYSGTLAVEYLGIADKARRDWVRERIEAERPALTAGARHRTLERLITAEAFEQFLHVRYAGQKRFSLEGGEALIPLLDALVEEAARLDVAELVLGMPHRGRLNVLAHVLEKPYELIFAEFEGAPLPEEVLGDGDVKYHLGFSHDHRTADGRTIHVSLSPNPSHLEAVNPVSRASSAPSRRTAMTSRAGRWRRCCCTATPPSSARASSSRRWRSAGSTASRPAARSTSSSTTRSASRRRRRNISSPATPPMPPT